jgi:type II secretory pathway component PulF
MPTYRYVAVGPDGNEIKEKLEAPSEDALRNQLLLRNLEVKQVKVKKTFN